MKSTTALLFLICIFGFHASLLAQTTRSTPVPRETSSITIPEPDLELLRQGGDTWDDAFPIPGLPYSTTGTNVGYTVNCCAEMCPYEAWGPAVFYSYTTTDNLWVEIDLCGSNYDTGLYVFDSDHSVIACNVDYYYDEECGFYVSKLEEVYLEAGQTYFVVVTGMSGNSGDYVFEMVEDQLTPECILDLTGTFPENEPPLEDEYQDQWNGGCNSEQYGSPFQALAGDANGHLDFSGISGWYGVSYYIHRDTDWFIAVIGSSGIIEVTFTPEVDSYLYQLAPLDCDSVAIAQSLMVETCSEGTMVLSGEPGSSVWLWVGPTLYSSPYYHPGNEYDYQLTLDGLYSGTVATENVTWDRLRAYYR
ncbi:MAG: hypothetical protein GY780_15250 [bacterium]|nr:hypothetical protein [bacterium]